MIGLLTPPPPVATVHADVKLVPLIFVGAQRGVNVEAVTVLMREWILWPAFDLNAAEDEDNERGHWRVWSGALDRTGRWPGGTERIVERAIAEACLTDAAGLPDTRPRLRAGQLEVAWQVNGQRLMRLVRSGELRGEIVGHTLHIWRVSAVAFLRRRLMD